MTKRQVVEEICECREGILEIEKSLEDTDLARVDVVNTILWRYQNCDWPIYPFRKRSTQRVSFRYSEGDIVWLLICNLFFEQLRRGILNAIYSIDLQMAIPRTPMRTSSLQSHALQKPVVNQIQMENESAKQTELFEK